MTGEEEAQRILDAVGEAVQTYQLRPGETLSIDFPLPDPRTMRVLLGITRPSECPNSPHTEVGVCGLCGLERVSALRVNW